MAGSTGLEPAASAVTGQRSNQLNYDPALCAGCAEALSPSGLATGESIPLLNGWWAVRDSNLRPPACKAGALTN
jgi:hypothetical protein